MGKNCLNARENSIKLYSVITVGRLGREEEENRGERRKELERG